MLRWTEATDDVGIRGDSLRYGEGSLSESDKEYKKYLLTGNVLEYTVPFESFADNEEYFFSIIAYDDSGKVDHTWSKDISIIVDYSEEAKVEQQAYIDATIEATCMIYQSEDLFDPALEEDSKEIFKDYGFDADNEAAMEALVLKYEYNVSAQNTILDALQDCETDIF